MDITEIARITIRRWYVALLILAIGVVAALAVSSGIKPSYAASIDAFVNAPASTTSRAAGSLENSGGVGFAGSFEERAMDADASRKQINSKGLLPGYTVTWTRATLVLTVSATGPTPDLVRRTVEEVVSMANSHLVAHQAANGVTERPAQFTIVRATDGANVSPAMYPGQGRQRLVIGAISVIAAVGLSVVLDGLIGSRRRSGAKNADRPEGGRQLPATGGADYDPTPLGRPSAPSEDGPQPFHSKSAIEHDTMTINTAARSVPRPNYPDVNRSGQIR